jgi:hypothetical protein
MLKTKTNNNNFYTDSMFRVACPWSWFSPGTPASSTTKTDRHDIAEILLKVALSTTNQINVCSVIMLDLDYPH